MALQFLSRSEFWGGSLATLGDRTWQNWQCVTSKCKTPKVLCVLACLLMFVVSSRTLWVLLLEGWKYPSRPGQSEPRPTNQSPNMWVSLANPISISNKLLWLNTTMVLLQSIIAKKITNTVGFHPSPQSCKLLQKLTSSLLPGLGRRHQVIRGKRETGVD